MGARKSNFPLENDALLRLGLSFALGGISFFLFSGASVFLIPFIFLGYFAQLPLFILGITAGYGDVLIAGAFGVFLNFLFSGEVHLLSYALFYVVPPSFLSYFLSFQKKPPLQGNSKLEAFFGQALLLGAIFLMTLFFFIFENTETQDLWRKNMGQLLKTLSQNDAHAFSPIFEELVHYLPALLSLTWMTMVFGNALLAQWIVKRLKKKPLYLLEFKNLSVSQGQYWLLAAALVGALFLSEPEIFFAKNLVLLTLVPFLIEGLAIFHEIYPKIMKTPWGIIVFYALVFFLGWPLLALVFLGIFEPWIHIRQRFAGLKSYQK